MVGDCRNQDGKKIESKADIMAHRYLLDVSEMKSEIQNGPISISVGAGNDCWRFYEKGILSKDNNCPGGMDHAVVIVGLDQTGVQPYWIIQNSWGTGWGN